MPTQDDPVQVYKELADCYDRRREPPMRDRFLVLAADAALRAGRADEADRLRLRLLKLNPHHMLKPYASFTQAMQAPDVQTYVRDLRLNYPPEVATVLLNSLRTAADDQTIQALPGPAPGAHAGDADATVALDEPPETFKVFPEQREPDVAETAALPAEFAELARRAAAGQPQPKTPVPAARAPAPPKSNPRQPVAPPLAKKKPAVTPRPQPIPTVLPAADQPAEEPEATSFGGWFAAGLFVLVVVAGILLGGYILARPFLQ
jgi:hypothetical protein